jgi:hypothetical protein
VPDLNTAWATYGCDKCDDFNLYIFETNVSNSDTKNAFQDYLDENSVEYLSIWSQDGGRALGDATGNGGTGNPKYLISPDKTYFKMDYGTWQTQLQDAGLEPHTCNTPVTQEKSVVELNTNITFVNFTKSNFIVNVLNGDVYSISIYSANGKLKTAISKKLSAGSHQINFEKGTLANGVYLVELRNSNNISREKVVLE